jgi:hypothetical protein
MAKEMQDVNERRFNPARAIAASAPAARILVVEDEAALSILNGDAPWGYGCGSRANGRMSDGYRAIKTLG